MLLYRQGGLLVVHRVIRLRSGPAYRTKGDGRPTFDYELVPAEAAVGRVVAFERDGRPRATEGRRPRFYSLLVTAHSEVVGCLSRAAARVDLILGRLAGGRSLRPVRWAVAVADRLVVLTLDRLLFRLCHPEWSPPERKDLERGG
jgi:hypothetical protein